MFVEGFLLSSSLMNPITVCSRPSLTLKNHPSFVLKTPLIISCDCSPIGSSLSLHPCWAFATTIISSTNSRLHLLGPQIFCEDCYVLLLRDSPSLNATRWQLS